MVDRWFRSTPRKKTRWSANFDAGADDDVWIGLDNKVDPDPETDYEWSDQTPFDYSNWKEGEPSMAVNDYSFENSAAMQAGGRWTDEYAYLLATPQAKRRVVCKLPRSVVDNNPNGFLRRFCSRLSNRQVSRLLLTSVRKNIRNRFVCICHKMLRLSPQCSALHRANIFH